MLAVPLTSDDVEGVYAGLRPLLAGESDATSKLSREHAVAHPVPGLVMVAGGKYTTYRVMAKDAVDAAVARPRPAGPRVAAPRSPAARRRGLPGAVERPGTGWPSEPGCTWPGSSTCCSRYGSLIARCWR